MTRFEIAKNCSEDLCTEIYDNGKRLSYRELVGLLNTLHQENLSLKFQLDECANNKLYSRRKLEEENEQLRHELDSLSGCYCADNKEFKDYWRIGYDG